MTTPFPHASSSHSNPSKADADEFEPDEDWKTQLRARIQLSLQSMVKDAKDHLMIELRKTVVSHEERMQLQDEYTAAMGNIKQLAAEQFEAELEKERNQRRWIAGEPMLPGWSTYLKAEQEHIMNTIKQGSEQPVSSERPYSHSSSPQPTAPATPATRTPEPRDASSPPSTFSSPQRKMRRRETEPTTTTASSTPDLYDPHPPQERSKPRSRPQSDYRAPRDREEEPSLVGRRSNGSAHDRQSTSSAWVTAEVLDEPEDLFSPSPPRTRYSSDKAPDRPFDGGSLGRSSGSVRSLTKSERGHSARSPSTQPENWKSKSMEEPMTSQPYANQVHRRGSTASMRSTGSGASIRPTTETILERDDIAEEGIDHRDWARELEKSRNAADKARAREKRLTRRDSRSSPADANVPQYDELGSSGGTRSAGPSSATMQYATHTPVKSLSNKSSFISMDECYNQDRSSKHLDQEYPPYREQRYPAQERELPRPPPPRSPYSGEEREYIPVGNKLLARVPTLTRPSYNADEREYHPIRDLLASRPTSSRPYSGEDRDYHTPSPSVRSPPPRSPYDDNYTNGYTGPSQRHTNGINGDYGPPSAALKPAYNHDDRRRDGWEREPPPWEEDHRDRDRELSYPRGDRDRERERMDWERDRERDRERDPHPDTRAQYSYAPPARAATYPSTSPTSLRNGIPNGLHDYSPVGEAYESRAPGPPPSRSYSYREHPPPPPSQSVPPEEYDYEYHRQENARSAPPARQTSFARRRDNPDPRDRPGPTYAALPDEVDQKKPLPAWRHWGRSPQDAAHPPPTTYGGPSGPNHRQRARGPPKPNQPYRNSRPSEFDHDTESASDEEEEDEYSEDIDLFAEADDSDGADDENDRYRRAEEPETSDGEDVQARIVSERKLKQQALELKRIEENERRLEEQTRKKEEEVREKEQELKRKAEENAKRAEEARRREAEVKRKAEEARLREEELERQAEEARQMEELRQKEEEAARKEARRIEEEARLKAEEVKRKEEEAQRKEEEVRKKEAEAKKKEREVNRREQEAKRKAAEAKKLEEEAKRKEDELKKKEEATRRKEEKLKQESEKTKILQQEAQKIAEEALEKQEKLKQLEEEARKWEKEIWEREMALHLREEELKRREEEAKAKEEEARRSEAEVKKKEDLARAQKEEATKREQARKADVTRLAKEEAAKRESAEHNRRVQAEAAQREELQRKQEARDEAIKRLLHENDLPPRIDPEPEEAYTFPFLSPEDLPADMILDAKLMEEQAYIWQQLQYKQQADSIQKKRQEQRSRHDSLGTDTSSWPYAQGGTPSQAPPAFSNRHNPHLTSPTSPSTSERSSGIWNGSSSAWSSSTKSTSSATSATSATSSRTPNNTQAPKPAMNIPSQGKSRAGSFSSGTYPAGSSPHSVPGTEEWQRRQTEFTNAQQEKFRREQEKLEAEAQMRSAGKPLSRDEMQRVFERHEQLWTQLPQKSGLVWNDFPWPMSKPPPTPDDISAALVGAYIRYNCWPDNDKSKSTKDRIKEHMKRWHPDRFETKLLPKVVESEKEKVKQGAGNVARYLSDLLRKENENSSSSNIFGD